MGAAWGPLGGRGAAIRAGGTVRRRSPTTVDSSGLPCGRVRGRGARRGGELQREVLAWPLPFSRAPWPRSFVLRAAGQVTKLLALEISSDPRGRELVASADVAGAHTVPLSLSLSLQQSLWKHTTGGARRPRRRGVARSECGASDALATASPRVLVIPALWGLGALFRTLSLSRSYHELPASHSLSGMAPPGDVVLGRTGAVLGQTARQRHDPDDEGAARGERRAGELGSRCPRLQCG